MWTIASAPTSLVAQPAVQRVVVVRRRQVGRVVDRVRVHAVAARRLQRHEDVAELQAGQRQRAVVDVRLAGRLAPLRAISPGARRAASANQAAYARPGTRPARAQAAPRSARSRRRSSGRSDRASARRRLAGSVADRRSRPSRIASSSAQQRGRRVQADRVADPRALALLVGEDRRRCASRRSACGAARPGAAPARRRGRPARRRGT